MSTSLNEITIPLSCESETTETENTLHKISECQEAFSKLGNVNHCTDNLKDSSEVEHQLLSLNNSVDFVIDSFTDLSNKKQKYTRNSKLLHKYISPDICNDNSEDYLCDTEFRSSVQIELSSTCVDIEAILKELDVEYETKRKVSKAIINIT